MVKIGSKTDNRKLNLIIIVMLSVGFVIGIGYMAFRGNVINVMKIVTGNKETKVWNFNDNVKNAKKNTLLLFAASFT